MTDLRPARNGFYLPVVEHAGHTPKWLCWPGDMPMPRGVERIEFSQARDEWWWMRVWSASRFRIRGQRILESTGWIPVPGFGFVLPEHARLQKKTAMLPQMTPAEWREAQRQGRLQDDEDD